MQSDAVAYTHFLLEPAHGLLFADAVTETNTARFPLLVGDAEAWSAQNLNTKTMERAVDKRHSGPQRPFIRANHQRNIQKGRQHDTSSANQAVNLAVTNGCIIQIYVSHSTELGKLTARATMASKI